MSPVINVKGAIDAHIHSAPCLYSRVGTDIDIARACKNAGMRAIVLKSHHEPTVTRAAMTTKFLQLEDPSTNFEVLGGVTLNSYLGGLNVRAVEAALDAGGRIVWMPTVEAAYHGEIFGGFGGLIKDMQVKQPAGFRGIAVSDGHRLVPEVVDVVRLAAERHAVVGAAHISPVEMLLLGEECAKCGATYVVNHPFFMPRVKDFSFYRQLAQMDAYLELCAVFCLPPSQHTSFEENWQLIEAVGDDHCYLATDAGNIYSPWPHEALRLYLQSMSTLGLTEERIRKLTVLNPAKVLGIEP